MSQITKKNNKGAKTRVRNVYVDLTDPIPDHVIGANVMNQVFSEVIRGILTTAQLRIWALELEREGLNEMVGEIFARIGDH